MKDAKFYKLNPCFAWVILFCMFWTIFAIAGYSRDRVRFKPNPEGTPRRGPQLDCEPTFVNFALDWTMIDIHRTDDDFPIVMTLPGTIESNECLVWYLYNSSLGQEIDRIPLVEDIFGNQYYMQNNEIPLTWEISLDNGPFFLMTILPDQTICTVFPPGVHNFVVRITGYLQYHQSDGYYMLELSQSLVPQL